jgi:2,5-diketo-D-gluconate reductase A
MTSAPFSVPAVTLADGRAMPRLGLGTWPLDDAGAREAVARGLDLGYRLIDTAASYGNEGGVGEAIAASSVPREEIFVTTKLRGRYHGYEETLTGFEESRKRLGLDYVDLYLIHWPLPRLDRYVETWRAFVELRERGLVKSIGVSNFTPSQIERIEADTGVRPVVNQIELSPLFSQKEMRAWHAARDIVTESWSPLAIGSELWRRPELAEIAEAHGRTIGQVILHWHVRLGAVPIPKSSNPERMAQNIDVFGFEFGDEEMSVIGSFDTGRRQSGDPDVYEEF